MEEKVEVMETTVLPQTVTGELMVTLRTSKNSEYLIDSLKDVVSVTPEPLLIEKQGEDKARHEW